MLDDELKNLLHQARSGDPWAREELLRSHRSFVAEVARNVCQRALYWENDHELSTGLLAFNEAIDSYNPAFKKDFRHYARIVIRNRLVDHFRKEARHHHLPLNMGEEGSEVQQWEAKESWKQHQEAVMVRERAEEIGLFEEILHSFGFSLEKLQDSCPRHRDTRENLVEVARVLASQENLAAYVNKNKNLPLGELERMTGVRRKVLKRGRHYILAVFLILTHPEFCHLRSLFSLS